MFWSSHSPSGRPTLQIQCHSSCKGAARSLKPCNPEWNYSVTVWIWLCQNSCDSQQANLQRPTQPSHRWLVLKNLYQHYCQDWNNPVYMRPSISHPSFLCSVQIWYQVSFNPSANLFSQEISVPRVLSVFHSWVKVSPQLQILYLVSRLPDAFPESVQVNKARSRKFHSTTWPDSLIFFGHAKSISSVEGIVGSL